MSLWSRLLGRKPLNRIDRNDGESWKPGDLAVCISDTWLQPTGSDPKVDDVLRVTGVENRVVDFRPRGFGFVVASTWLSFGGTGWRWYSSSAFRKAQEDDEPAEVEFTALIRREVRPKVPVPAHEWR